MKNTARCGAKRLRLQNGFVPGETAAQRMERERLARLRAAADQEAAFAARDAAQAAKAPARGPVILAPGAIPATAVQPATTPAATAAPAPAPTASIGGAASALRGRGIDEMGKRYGFKTGLVPAGSRPFVKAPPGVPKKGDHIDVKLEHGEAVLPAKTVQAIGPENIVQTIKDTNDGKMPKLGARRGGKYVGGVVPEDDDWLKQTMPGTAATYRGAGEDIRSAYGAGGLPSAAGATLRAATAYPVAVANDLSRSAGKVIYPAVQALKTAVTGDPTPIGQEQPPAAVTRTAPVATPAARVQPVPAAAVQPTVPAPTQQPVAEAPQAGALNTATMGGRTVSVAPGGAYRGADGKPTNDWYKTADYAEGVRRADKDKYDAAVLDIGEAARTRSGAEGERQKRAAMAAVNLGPQGWGARQKSTQDAAIASQQLESGKQAGLIQWLNLKQQERLSGLYEQYMAETDPNKQAVLAEQLRTLTGKDKPDEWAYLHAAGGTDEWGVKRPDVIVGGSKRTGQTRIVAGGAGQPANKPTEQVVVENARKMVASGKMTADQANAELKKNGYPTL